MNKKDKNYYQAMLEEFEKDPKFHVEYSLLELTENICVVHPKQGLRIEIILWCIGKLTDLAMWIKPKTTRERMGI